MNTHLVTIVKQIIAAYDEGILQLPALKTFLLPALLKMIRSPCASEQKLHAGHRREAVPYGRLIAGLKKRPLVLPIAWDYYLEVSRFVLMG
ncbi:MAG: hypothetical protein LBB61_08650 [Treponema sp.]|nr:hypothetical protein [Treponema sp.]